MNISIAGEDFTVHHMQDLSQIDFEPQDFITFDSETTGLHLKADKPFLGGICVDHDVYIFPPTVQNLNVLVRWAGMCKRVYGHNITYDMHMVDNAGVNPLQIKNWGDTMGLCRLVFEAVSTRDGGDRLGLKEVSKKYIDKNSDRYEAGVKGWMQAKKAADKRLLTAVLHGFKDENGRKWTVKRLEEALNDGTEWVPEEILEAYQTWRHEYPDPTNRYDLVPLDIMIPYLAVDVILTRLLVLKCMPVIIHRDQLATMNREFNVIPVVYKMQSNGIAVDLDYLEKASKNLEDYINSQYAKLHLATGLNFTVYQNAVIKQIYTDLLGEEPNSTDKKFLGKMMEQGDKAGEIAGYINRIRRFEKWKSVYVDRIIDNARKSGNGRVYTQMSQYNPVSGRFSGDFQQMPKDPIYTEEGYVWEKEHRGKKVPKEYVLYHPRAAFKPSGNGMKYMLFSDFSQVELRVQAHYTIPFGGDVNLCRAYCPYKCTHYLTGEEYRFDTHENRWRWDEKQPSGESAWLDENGQPWQKTDVHMATTLKALVAMGFDPNEMSKEDLDWWRKKGKTFNFGRNYGMGDTHAAETLDIELSQAKALNKGYSDAFPLVVTYQNNVVKAVQSKGYVRNLLGRRYYLSNWNKAYKCANYLVQGSCADDLKEKMYLIDQFLTTNNCKSKLILCIHDELIFEIHEDETWIVPEIKRIMERTDHILIPIVAEVEYTETTWAEKKSWEEV